jgi:hypothetical protein
VSTQLQLKINNNGDNDDDNNNNNPTIVNTKFRREILPK